MRTIVERGFDSNSASPTDILLVQPIVGKLVMKMYVIQAILKDGVSYNLMDVDHEDLDFEVEIYKRLKKELIDDPILQVRNIIPYIETVEFSFEMLRAKLIMDFQTQGSPLTVNQISNNLIENTLIMLKILTGPGVRRKKINRAGNNSSPSFIYSLSPYTFDVRSVIYRGIVTANGGSYKFTDYLLRGANLQYTDIMRYFGLILIAIRAMAKKGVNQNDLHFGNILMSEELTGLGFQLKKYFLYYKEYLFLIDQEYTPFVYDFDRSSLQNNPAGINNRLVGLEHGGNCPSFHLKRDLAKVVCSFYNHVSIRQQKPPNGTIAPMDPVEEKKLNKGADFIHNNFVRGEIKDSFASGASCFMHPVGQSSLPSDMCSDDQLNQNVTTWDIAISWVLSEGKFTSIKWSERTSPGNINTYRQMLQEANIARQMQGYTIDDYLSANFQWVGDGSMNSNLTAFSTTGRSDILSNLRNELS